MSSTDENKSTNWLVIIIGVIVTIGLISLIVNQYRNNEQVNEAIDGVNQSLIDLNDSVDEYNEQAQEEPAPEEPDAVTPVEE